MNAQTQKFSRDLLVSSFSVILTVAFGAAAWGVTDRMHWAAKEQLIDDNAKGLEAIQGKIDSLPSQFVTRQEFEQVRDLIQSEHADTINAINHLGDRIDHLATMSGVPASKVDTSHVWANSASKSLTAAKVK